MTPNPGVTYLNPPCVKLGLVRGGGSQGSTVPTKETGGHRSSVVVVPTVRQMNG